MSTPIANHYGVIYADPPWTFATRSPKGKGRSPEQHYSCMSLDEIKNLPVSQWATPDAILLMWVTDPMLRIGFDVIDAWGFRYSTVGFHWTKTNANGKPFIGMGYWTRANPELCLLATRGRPKRKHADVPRSIISPRREHSRKPDEIYDRIERLVAGPYLELFARTTRPGWTSWGNETSRFP